MLIGQAHEVEHQMALSPLRFHLTGSRAFGTHTTESDTDYFTEDCREARDFLVRSGFVENFVGIYRADPTIVAVFVHHKERIHVQLVENISQKVNAQKLIAGDPDLRYLLTTSKENAKRVWSYAMRVFA